MKPSSIDACRLRGLCSLSLPLMLLAACSPQESQPSSNAVAPVDSIDKLVQVIQREVTRTAALSEEPDTAEHRRRTVEAPHWQFFDVFEKAEPVFLHAIFSEGDVVREEKYYLAGGKLILVNVEQWWDLEGKTAASDPPSRQTFYLENDRKIRQVTQVDASPPANRQDDTSEPAEALVQRSRTIAQILSGGEKQAVIPESLAAFPQMSNVPPR